MSDFTDPLAVLIQFTVWLQYQITQSGSIAITDDIVDVKVFKKHIFKWLNVQVGKKCICFNLNVNLFGSFSVIILPHEMFLLHSLYATRT